MGCLTPKSQPSFDKGRDTYKQRIVPLGRHFCQGTRVANFVAIILMPRGYAYLQNLSTMAV